MILKLIIAAVLLYLFYRLLRMLNRPKAKPKAAPTAAAGEDLVEDPLCHTYVPVTHARRYQIDGKTVYFCSDRCLEQYKQKQKQD